jgi:hypothetical protein
MPSRDQAVRATLLRAYGWRNDETGEHVEHHLCDQCCTSRGGQTSERREAGTAPGQIEVDIRVRIDECRV